MFRKQAKSESEFVDNDVFVNAPTKCYWMVPLQIILNYIQGCWRARIFLLCPFTRGATGAEVLFSIIGNLMVYEDRVETNLSQLFVHTENSEWLSIISNIIL